MQKIRHLLNVILFTALASISFAPIAKAQLNPADTLRPDTQVKIGKLENGLTYYIRKNNKPEKNAELRLVIKAGSMQEDDDQQGLAHLQEHLAFNGTKNFKRNDIISYLQSIGVEYGNDLNAYTSFDETVYQLPIPLDKPGNLEKGLQIMEDWAHQISNLDEAINSERNIVLEESREGRGADDRMFKQIYPRLFAGSRYASRLPIGQDSLVKNAPTEALRRFYKDWYRPNLMGVFIVGDIDPLAAEALVKKHFSALQNPLQPRAKVPGTIPPYASPEALVVTDKEATTFTTMLVWSAQPATESVTVNDYKNDLVRSMFLALVNQRLRELTQKENPPYLGASIDYSFAVNGFRQFSCNVFSGTADINTAITAALQVLEQARRFGFTSAEVGRAKQNLLANYDRGFKERNKTESVDYIEEYVRNFLTTEPIPGIATEYAIAQAMVPQITLAEVNAVSNQLPKDGKLFIALTGPKDNKEVAIPSPESLLASALAVEKVQTLSAYAETSVSEKLMENAPKSGKVVKETLNPNMGTKTWILSNGIAVTIKKTSFKNDQILLAARRPGGLSNYGPADNMNARYASAIVNSMGTATFTPLDLQKVLTGKIANASAVIGSTTDGFSGSSSTADVETMLQLLYLRATVPRTDSSLFRSFIQKSKAQMSFAMADPQNVFIDTLIKTIYNNHPLTPISYPSPAQFDSISLSRCLQIYNERVGDVTGMHFFIVGAFDEKKLKPLIETYIGSLPAAGIKTTFKDRGLRPADGIKKLLVEKGETDKALVLMMQTGVCIYSEDLDLKAQIIGELLTMKIDEVLREKIQGIYSGSASLSVSKLPYQNFQLFVQLPCNPDKADTLIAAFNAEIQQLKTRGPKASDLQKIKKQWLESNKISFKENGSWLGQLVESSFPGASEDRFLHFEKYLNAVTAQQIQQTAKQLLSGKNSVTAILKPTPNNKTLLR